MDLHYITGKQQDEESIDLKKYLQILNKRKFSILFVTLAFFLLGFFVANRATPIYQATAKIQADPIQPNATTSDQYIMNSMVFLFYETQYEIIQSRKIAETVVDKLNLIERYKNELAEQQFIEEESNFIGSIVDSVKGQIKNVISSDEQSEEAQPLTDEQQRQQPKHYSNYAGLKGQWTIPPGTYPAPRY